MARADDVIIVGDARGVRRVHLGDYLHAELAERAEREANAWVKSLRHVPIEGLPFRERFTHRGDSLWWFAELYLHKMQVANRVFRTLLALEALVERGAAGAARRGRVEPLRARPGQASSRSATESPGLAEGAVWRRHGSSTCASPRARISTWRPRRGRG